MSKENYILNLGYFLGNPSSSTSKRRSPRSLFAIIFPSGSTKKDSGIPDTLYSCAASFPQPFKSLTCFQERLSFSMASSHACFLPGLSRDTPRTVNPRSLNFS